MPAHAAALCSVDESNTCRWQIERVRLTNAQHLDWLTSGLYRLVPTAEHPQMLFALGIRLSYGHFDLIFESKDSNHVAGTNGELITGECWLEDTVVIANTNRSKFSFC